MEYLNSNSQERELHQLQQLQDKAKESCMTSFRLHQSHLKVLSINDLKRHGSEGGYERAFASLFVQDVQTFTGTMLLNLDQLEKQLDKEEFQEERSMAAFWFRETLLQHMDNVKKSVAAERTHHKRQYDIRMNERHMQSRESKVVSSKALDDSLVVTECSRTKSDEHITCSSSGTYITHVVDAYIRPINNQKSSAEISKGYRFSPNKFSVVDEKPNTPRSCLRWKSTGRIFKTTGLRCIPTGKMFIDCTTKVDSKPLNGSNDDITNPYECDQTLNVSTGLVPQPPSPIPNLPPTKNEWDTVFFSLFDEYFNPQPRAVSPVPAAVAAPRAVDPAGSPSSTTIDQDV
nr:hypothetical protein [Tanacetum cinerariifolium]